jgi:two-component system NtrC family sensor kinase
MPNAKILVVADTPEVSSALIDQLLPAAGYTAIKADDFNAPPAADAILVDISQLRSASPFSGLKAQRRMGCEAPALLFVPRLTEQMAAEVFTLGIRDLALKPLEDETRLSKLAEFVTKVLTERDQAAVQTRLSETQADLQRRLEEMNTLSKIGRGISAATDVDTILARIVEAAVYLTKADEGAVFLLDEKTGQLILRAEQGMGTQRAAALKQPSQDSDAMVALQTSKPVLKGGETEHKVKTGYLARALVNVPIVMGDRAVGVLAVYGMGAQAFELTDQAVVSSLADYAAIALSKVQSMEQVAAQARSAVEAARKTLLHAETLFDPVDGIESQIDTLMTGGFGPVSETQHSAMSRIKSAAGRIKEVIGFIRETVNEAQGRPSSGGR